MMFLSCLVGGTLIFDYHLQQRKSRMIWVFLQLFKSIGCVIARADDLPAQSYPGVFDRLP